MGCLNKVNPCWADLSFFTCAWVPSWGQVLRGWGGNNLCLRWKIMLSLVKLWTDYMLNKFFLYSEFFWLWHGTPTRLVPHAGCSLLVCHSESHHQLSHIHRVGLARWYLVEISVGPILKVANIIDTNISILIICRYQSLGNKVFQCILAISYQTP